MSDIKEKFLLFQNLLGIVGRFLRKRYFMNLYRFVAGVGFVGFLLFTSIVNAEQIRQYVPPSSSPDTVYIGTPNIYYYPVPAVPYGGGAFNSGATFYQPGNRRGFWSNTPGGAPYDVRRRAGAPGYYVPYGGGGIYFPQ